MAWSQQYSNTFNTEQQTQAVLKNHDNEFKYQYTVLNQLFAANGHAHTGNGVDGKQIAYSTLTGIPSTFAPSAHNHDLLYEPINANIQAHISSVLNPHGVTATQVLPTQTGQSGKYLITNGEVVSWGTVSTPGYTLPGGFNISAEPTDNQTNYFGSFFNLAPSTTAGASKIYIPRTGIIKSAHFMWFAGTAGGTGEISMSIRLNNATDTLIAAVNTSSASKEFVNTALNIAVTAGDYIHLKNVFPNWGASTPSAITVSGYVYVE